MFQRLKSILENLSEQNCQSLFPVFFTISIIIGFSSCSESGEGTFQKSYFPLSSYFQNKEKDFSNRKVQAYKTLLLEGRRQSLQIKNPEWSREMIFFKESEINKPAWAGKFKIELIKGNLVYTSLDTNKMNIREVDFYQFKLPDSSFDSLRIVKKERNFLSNLSTILVYKPDSAYSIAYDQDFPFYKGNHYKLWVRIKP
jgi:hypothetical protein